MHPIIRYPPDSGGVEGNLGKAIRMSDSVERRILVTGATGQVGFELLRSLRGLGRVVAPDRQTLDIANFDQIRRVFSEVKPTLVVNAAAYTAVEQAESDSDTAMRVNADAPGVMAQEARRVGAMLFHYSTDYVFDGVKAGPYVESDPPNPINVYGASKLAGERAVVDAGGKCLVFRTSWVYGNHGHNFLRTILGRAGQQAELKVVSDQIGAPTWSRTIATTTAHIASQILQEGDSPVDGRVGYPDIYHLNAEGVTSWAGFAQAILDLAAPHAGATVLPIPSESYATRAKRPRNSCLSTAKLSETFGIRPPHWREALQRCLESRADASNPNN
jgi:dTDP-4-dehydrorhamnose reductase